MKGLAADTAKIFDSISKLETIRNYTLVGGTALALQINHRLSEDLDFMQWPQYKSERKEVDWVAIERELKDIGNLQKTEILSFSHVEYIVNDVKLSFYIAPNLSPIHTTIPYLNNIYLADIDSIAIMKMEVLLRRSKFRDYYDLYCIFKERNDEDIQTLITDALRYSGHKLRTKNLLAILTNSHRFMADASFHLLSPIYSITASQIEEYMKDRLHKIYNYF